MNQHTVFQHIKKNPFSNYKSRFENTKLDNQRIGRLERNSGEPILVQITETDFEKLHNDFLENH
jgi:hypothetical protein